MDVGVSYKEFSAFVPSYNCKGLIIDLKFRLMLKRQTSGSVEYIRGLTKFFLQYRAVNQ